MNKLLKTSTDLRRSPNSVLSKMIEKQCEYVTWSNMFSGARFITKKSTVEKLAENKRAELAENEIVKIFGTSLTSDEVKFEMDASNSNEITIVDGLSGNQKTKITRKQINLLEEVLYNNEFDCSSLFNNSPQI